MNSVRLESYTGRNSVKTPADALGVRAVHHNDLLADVTALEGRLDTPQFDTISEETAGAGVTIDSVLLKDGGVQLATGVIQKEAVVTLTAATIVGTAAGTLGHADGVTLVAGAGAGYTLELVSATAFFNGMGTAYTGGGDDTVIQLAQIPMTGVVSKINLLGATGDKIVMFKPLAITALPLTVNTALNIKSTTAWTQPGGAAGTLEVRIVYRLHATGF